jgi:hypothetical protein
VRRIAGAAWRFRFGVEREAEVRFGRLAKRLLEAGAAPVLVGLAARAATDERRHAERCAELAESYGAPVDRRSPAVAAEIAPAGLPARERLLYEVVAACCVAETESVGVLSTLLGCARGAALRRVLKELAQDEVGHGRLGWAHLAAERARGDTSFLGPLVPAMLEGNAAADLFATVEAEREDPALLEEGVLPHSLKREVFVRMLEEVIFPGLERFGVDAGDGRAWLAAKRARLDART